eukprot:8030679-Heterocapsa_arctica.AAC.1
MKTTLTRLYREPGSVWGGMFYPATLRSVKKENGRWKTFSNVSTGGAVQPAIQADRDIHALQI